jgi:hypothetical protein
MQKEHIFQEIRRTADAKHGAALGKKTFYAETGIKESDWQGKFWARWSDAVRDVNAFLPTQRDAGNHPYSGQYRVIGDGCVTAKGKAANCAP